ncbi:hypothetical protein X962_4642 [Burkholderia pseudomallei MSHR7343]|nr:hypothetical protein X962_4642 [Burkholderia pseudomallei MSHR7343]KGS79452.1 hypothetical protein X947_4352 [Burkholderia pseudomallei MSHR7334]
MAAARDRGGRRVWDGGLWGVRRCWLLDRASWSVRVRWVASTDLVISVIA